MPLERPIRLSDLCTKGGPPSKGNPEGPSTHYLRTLVPKTRPYMAFGTRVLKEYLDPLGYPSNFLRILMSCKEPCQAPACLHNDWNARTTGKKLQGAAAATIRGPKDSRNTRILHSICFLVGSTWNMILYIVHGI